MAYATNNDILKYVPTIFDHGIEDFGDELALAEGDVKRYIEINWYNKTFGTAYDQFGKRVGQEFDDSKLTATQWTRAIVYRALCNYILPQLATWTPNGDVFTEQIRHYKNRFEEEISAEMAKGVEYDLDGDDSIATSERFKARRDRLYR